METILFIEDERLPMKYYIEELNRGGFIVKLFRTTDDTINFVRTKPDLDIVILDIMMLPGIQYKDYDTDDGLKTGIFLYEDIIKLYPNIPLIVLTNVGNQSTLNYFQDRPRVKVVQKLDYPPHALLQLVISMIKDANKPV
jgi:CheY-like chemotaxis protein